MNPPRWAKTHLPEPLARALASGEPAQPNADAAALARMRERLQSSIGPAFDGRSSGQVLSHSAVLLKRVNRGKWLAVSALVSASLAFFGTRAALQPEAPSPQPLPLTAAVLQAPKAAPSPAAEPVPTPSPEITSEPRSPQRRVRRPPTQQGLAEELKGIAHIRQLLKTAPAKALAATEEQQRSFAHGVLAPERELLRIEALLKLNRISEAKTRAARAGSAGDQPYREQIEKLLRSAEH